jgi:hypothetical protein
MSVGPDWRRVLVAVRRALGAETVFHLNAAADPRLLRLGMAVVYPEPRRPRADGLLADPPLSPAAITRLARRLDEPVALLRRLHQLYTRPVALTRWLHRSSPTIAALFDAANTHHGALDARDAADLGYRMLWQARQQLGHSAYADDWDLDASDVLLLRPCGHCGERRRLPLRLREADGAVCTRCRCDQAGVPWPADPYDYYVQAGKH